MTFLWGRTLGLLTCSTGVYHACLPTYSWFPSSYFVNFDAFPDPRSFYSTDISISSKRTSSLLKHSLTDHGPHEIIANCLCSGQVPSRSSIQANDFHRQRAWIFQPMSKIIKRSGQQINIGLGTKFASDENLCVRLDADCLLRYTFILCAHQLICPSNELTACTDMSIIV